jgi:hypothetical protein
MAGGLASFLASLLMPERKGGPEDINKSILAVDNNNRLTKIT